MTGISPLTMLDYSANQELYRDRLQRWQQTLRHEAIPRYGLGPEEEIRKVKAPIWYVPTLDACLRLGKRSPPVLSEGEFEVASFRLGKEPGEPWLVQINLPSPTQERGETRLAQECGSGRIWLMRRGNLQRNGHTGRITDTDFRDRRKPDDVLNYDGNGLFDGSWYKVAMLDGTPDMVRSQTRAFLQLCEDVLTDTRQKPTRQKPGSMPM